MPTCKLKAPNKRKQRLLGIDPSPSLRAVLGRFGEESGFVVATCADVAAARSHLAGVDFDLVITAAELPDGSYPDVLAAVRARSAMVHIPVILLIAGRSDNVVQEALNKGMTEVFFKRDLVDLSRYLQQFSACAQARKRADSSLRALVVEDDRALGAYYKALLAQQGLSVDYVPSGEAALWEAKRRCYDFILIDLVLGGSCSGTRFLRRLRDPTLSSSQAVAIAISSYDDEARRLEALRAGANAFIPKPIGEAELRALIQGMAQRRSPAGDRLLVADADTGPTCSRCQPCQLTPRESNICALVAAGYSDKRIAEEMGVSYWTVRTHIAHAFKKCQTSNRVELVRRLQGA